MSDRQLGGCLCFLRKRLKNVPPETETRPTETRDGQCASEAADAEQHAVDLKSSIPVTSTDSATAPVGDPATATTAAPQPAIAPAITVTAVPFSTGASSADVAARAAHAAPAPASPPRACSPPPSPVPAGAHEPPLPVGTARSPQTVAGASDAAGAAAHLEASALSCSSHASTAYYSAGGWSQFGEDGEWLGGSCPALDLAAPAEPDGGPASPQPDGPGDPGPSGVQPRVHGGHHPEHHEQQHPHPHPHQHPPHHTHPERPSQSPARGAPLASVDERDDPVIAAAAAAVATGEARAAAAAATAATAGEAHGLVPQPSLLPELPPRMDVGGQAGGGTATVTAVLEQAQSEQGQQQQVPQPRQPQQQANGADVAASGLAAGPAPSPREAMFNQVAELYSARARPCKAHQVLLQYCKSASIPPESLTPELHARKLPDASALTKVVQSVSECLADIATDAGWQVVRNDELQLLYRHLPGPGVHAFRARCTLEYPVEQILAITREIDLVPTWNKYCTTANVLRENSPTDLVVYMSLWTPWPLNNVGFLVEATGSELYAEEGCLLISFKSPDKGKAAGELPPLPACAAKHNKVRLLAPSCICLRPLPPKVAGGPQRVRAVVQAYVDPNMRAVPPFIISFVLKVLSPFVYSAVLKVLASAFKSPDNPLPQRIKQHAELYDMVRGLTEAYLKTQPAVAPEVKAPPPSPGPQGSSRGAKTPSGRRRA